MKFDKIVAFGDSFVWGDELINPALRSGPPVNSSHADNRIYRESNCFLGRLGTHYGVPTENFGWPGGSLQSTIWTYLWWIEHETLPLDRVLVLVGLTDGNRTSFYDPNHIGHGDDPPWNKFMHSTWIRSGADAVPKDWVEMGKRYMILTDCDELVRLNHLQALLFFDGQVKRHAGLLQFKTNFCELHMQVPSLLWPKTSLNEFFNDRQDRKDFFHAGGHLNENGHENIAHQLTIEIARD